MKNENELPAEILELSGKKTFSLLSQTEQNMVLKFFTEKEYDELYLASRDAAQYFATDKNVKPPLSLKQNLVMAFRQKHQHQNSVLRHTVALWKAAAVFLLFFSGTCLYVSKSAPSQSASEKLVHDTVFVEKKIEQIKHIIDTVVEYRYAAANTNSARKKTKLNGEVSKDMHDTAFVGNGRSREIGIRGLQPEDLLKELPNKNGKSMQEDELLKRFSFAKI